MNAQRKKSALSAWLPAVTKDTDLKDLKELILKDEKKYTDEEADEIIKAIEVALNEPAPDEKKSVNKKYAEWKVRPVFKQIKDEMDKVIGNKLEGFEKDAQSPVRFTTISPDTAELLNSQAINTNIYLYEV